MYSFKVNPSFSSETTTTTECRPVSATTWWTVSTPSICSSQEWLLPTRARKSAWETDTSLGKTQWTLKPATEVTKTPTSCIHEIQLGHRIIGITRPVLGSLPTTIRGYQWLPTLRSWILLSRRKMREVILRWGSYRSSGSWGEVYKK